MPNLDDKTHIELTPSQQTAVRCASAWAEQVNESLSSAERDYLANVYNHLNSDGTPNFEFVSLGGIVQLLDQPTEDGGPSILETIYNDNYDELKAKLDEFEIKTLVPRHPEELSRSIKTTIAHNLMQKHLGISFDDAEISERYRIAAIRNNAKLSKELKLQRAHHMLEKMGLQPFSDTERGKILEKIIDLTKSGVEYIDWANNFSDFVENKSFENVRGHVYYHWDEYEEQVLQAINLPIPVREAVEDWSDTEINDLIQILKERVWDINETSEQLNRTSGAVKHRISLMRKASVIPEDYRLRYEGEPTPEQYNDMVDLYRKGVNKVQISKQLGIPEGTIHHAVRVFQEQGVLPIRYVQNGGYTVNELRTLIKLFNTGDYTRYQIADILEIRSDQSVRRTIDCLKKNDEKRIAAGKKPFLKEDRFRRSDALSRTQKNIIDEMIDKHGMTALPIYNLYFKDDPEVTIEKIENYSSNRYPQES